MSPSASTSPQPAESSTYRQSQSLVRGLELLAALNQLPSGCGSISQLAHLTGIHRTTVKRLLETLCELGYLIHDGPTNQYRLAFRVQLLSHGFRDTVSLVDQAWPEMFALSKEVIWPCTLTVPEADELVVRTSTRYHSRLSFHPGMPGRSLPMLSTAAGRAYLSNISDVERDTLLEMIRRRNDEQAELAHDHQFVQRVIRETRERGYSVSLGEWRAEPKFGGVGIAIRLNGDVVASLNLVFLVRAVAETGSLSKLAQSLQETGRRIEQRINALSVPPES